MENNDSLERALQPLFFKVIEGQTVKIGRFKVYEDYLYTRKKNKDGQPEFNRVLNFAYFDADSPFVYDSEDFPSTENFDGTMNSFIECLIAHNALDYYDVTTEELADVLEKDQDNFTSN